MTKETAIPVFHVKQNQDIEVYRGKIKEDKVYLEDGKVAQFTNSGVFTIVNKLNKRTRRFKAVVYTDGKAECAEIRPADEIIERAVSDMDPKNIEKNPELKDKITGRLERLLGNAYSIFEPLTDQDRKTVVKREVAKQLGKFKPLQTWQFVLIIVLLGASIAIQFIPGL